MENTNKKVTSKQDIIDKYQEDLSYLELEHSKLKEKYKNFNTNSKFIAKKFRKLESSINELRKLISDFEENFDPEQEN